MGCAAQETSVAVPESGFVSSEQYTNAFFGFSLPLPQDSALRGFALPSNFHSLFGLQPQTNGLTTFAIFAKETSGASSKLARGAPPDPKNNTPTKRAIPAQQLYKIY